MKHVVPSPIIELTLRGNTYRDILSGAATLLAQHYGVECPYGLAEPDEPEPKPTAKRRKKAPGDQPENPTFDELHPSTRTTTVLAKVLTDYTVGPLPVEELRQKRLTDIIAVGRDRIARTKGAGEKVLAEIEGWLEDYGHDWLRNMEGEPIASDEEVAGPSPEPEIEDDEEPNDEDDEDDEDATDQTPFTFDWARMRLRGLMDAEPELAKEIGSRALRQTGVAVPNAGALPEAKRQEYADLVRAELEARELPL